MKPNSLLNKAFVALLIAASLAAFTSCINNSEKIKISKAEIDSLRNQIKVLTANHETIAKNLITFDTLDYTVFSNQAWMRLHESHSKDVKVNWPDGHFTNGIIRHI